MKKIYRYLLTAVALLSLIPLAKADGEEPVEPQKGPDYYLNDPDPEKASIGYKKSISEPNTDGVYYITLESFATGQSVRLYKSIPADIVLVLDVSGSMEENMSGGTASQTNPSRLSVMKTAVNNFIDKIDENDRIDPETGETRAKRLGNRIAIVAFSGPNNAAQETPTSSNSIKLNTGWRLLGNGQSTSDFAGYNYLKNTAVEGLTAGGGTFSNFGMEAAYNLLSNLGDDHQLRTVVFFTDGDPGRGNRWTDTENNLVNGHRVLTNTYGIYTWRTANQAIGFANDIKELADEDKKIISKVYSVSIITSPSSYTNVYLDQISSNYSGAEYMAELLTTTSGGYRPTTYYYIDNWNNYNNTWTARTGSKIANKYSFATTNAEELNNIFDTIAEDSGGGSDDLGEQAVTEVDVVSASFMMPPGTNKSSIKVYLERCDGTAEKTYIDEDDGTTKTGEFLQFVDRRGPIVPPNSLSGYTYDDDGDPDTPEVAADRNINVDFGKSGTDPNNPNKEDMIIVNGFDYGKNWCGPRYDTDGTTILGYHGYKLVVVIPIMMDTNAVGGPDISTNADGSGIIVNEVNVAPFKSPKVSLPVNIHIRKEGLDVGESAKFTIQRKYVNDSDATGTNNWIDVSSVFVTRHKGQEASGANAPVTKVVGMPSVDENDKEFIYQVVEDNWNWSGTLVSIKGQDGTTIGNVNTRSATTEELVTNPFIFVNEEKNNIDVNVRHAESKATNVFHTTKQGGYDDSKDNKRAVITVTSSSDSQ